MTSNTEVIPMKALKNYILRERLAKYTTIVLGLPLNIAKELYTDISCMFPDIIFITPITRNPETGSYDNEYRNVTMRIIGRKPSQNTIDRISFFVTGWLMARKIDYQLTTIQESE
jgi:hypothetical protein